MENQNSNNIKYDGKTAFFLTRVLVILFGIAALAWSGYVLDFMVYFFAIFAFIGSIGTIAVALSYRREQLPSSRWLVLLLGILGLLIGVTTVIAPAFMTVAIIYFIGAWALVTGVGDLAYAFIHAPAGNPRLVLVISGIISVLFGLLVLFNPPILTAIILVQVLGIYAILIGLLGVGFSMTEKSGTLAPTSPA